MDAVLRPPLNPATTRRPAAVAIAVAVLVLSLVIAGQRSPAARVASPASPQLRTTDAVSSATIPLPSADVAAAVTGGAPTGQAVALIDLAMDFIEPFEGRRHKAYRDSRGYITVGVGFNLDRAGASQDIHKLLPGVGYRALRRGEVSLTDAQIDVLLRHDTQRAIDTARRQVTGFDTLPLDAQLIVIDMTYNTGSLHKWRDLRSALARQDFASAADAMHRSRWRRQTGRRARSLIELMQGLAQS
jgi:GH24 family phage-related lysozyme (muramidase)